jgi:hypothetical protein
MLNWAKQLAAHKIKGYRTVAFNSLAGVLAAAEAGELTHLVPNEYQWVFIAGVSLVNIYLRSITNTPLGKTK